MCGKSLRDYAWGFFFLYIIAQMKYWITLAVGVAVFFIFYSGCREKAIHDNLDL